MGQNNEVATVNAQLADFTAFATMRGTEIYIQVEKNEEAAVRQALGENASRYKFELNAALASAE